MIGVVKWMIELEHCASCFACHETLDFDAASDGKIKAVCRCGIVYELSVTNELAGKLRGHIHFGESAQ